MSNRWLFKTEPSEYSFEDLLRDGRTAWEGVSNALALRHLASVHPGDRVMIYHTGSVKAIVGLATVVGAGPVIVPDRPLVRPIPLEKIKKNPKFRKFDLVRIGRLSVMPIPGGIWEALLKL